MELDADHLLILLRLRDGPGTATAIAERLGFLVDEVLARCEDLRQAGLIDHVPPRNL
jgi:DNA-binding Lrp family transcriptional regulator